MSVRRIYRHACDVCGRTMDTTSETRPDGWETTRLPFMHAPKRSKKVPRRVWKRAVICNTCGDALLCWRERHADEDGSADRAAPLKGGA